MILDEGDLKRLSQLMLETAKKQSVGGRTVHIAAAIFSSHEEDGAEVITTYGHDPDSLFLSVETLAQVLADLHDQKKLS